MHVLLYINRYIYTYTIPTDTHMHMYNIHLHTHPYTYTDTHTHAYTHSDTYTCTCRHTQIHTEAHTDTLHMHTHTYADTCICMHMHACAHIYTHACTHVHTHTCEQYVIGGRRCPPGALSGSPGLPASLTVFQNIPGEPEATVPATTGSLASAQSPSPPSSPADHLRATDVGGRTVWPPAGHSRLRSFPTAELRGCRD